MAVSLLLGLPVAVPSFACPNIPARVTSLACRFRSSQAASPSSDFGDCDPSSSSESDSDSDDEEE